jgi:hypothetical protein
MIDEGAAMSSVNNSLARAGIDAPMVARLRGEMTNQPYPLLFVTVSGAHLYGFASPDSDYDLRGAHALPAREVVGLDVGPETIEVAEMRGDLELDLVTYDVKKLFELLLKKNGAALEQVLSPLVILTTPAHAELMAIARRCPTRHHIHHYLGFSQAQWRLFEKDQPHRVKPLLYIYRVLLTGIHLMRTGVVESHLPTLNAEYRLPQIDDLIARKQNGPERATLDDADMAFHHSEYERLCVALREAATQSSLPDVADTRPALHDLLLRLRLGAADEASATADDTSPA